VKLATIAQIFSSPQGQLRTAMKIYKLHILNALKVLFIMSLLGLFFLNANDSLESTSNDTQKESNTNTKDSKKQKKSRNKSNKQKPSQTTPTKDYNIITKNQIPNDSTKDDSIENIDSKAIDSSKIIGGIALKVNGDPITLYEISSIQKAHHIPKPQAIDFLIAQRLKTQEIARLNINVDDERIDQEIEVIASQNHLNYQQFIAALYREGINLDDYKKQLKDQIQTRELMRNILLSSESANERAMREYYNAHKNYFIAPSSIDVVRYSAKDPTLLEQTRKNPSLSIKGVEKNNETLDSSSLNPQILQLFSSLKTGEFSPVMDAGGGSYVGFLIQKKSGEDKMSFEEAKAYIAQRLAQTNQEQVLSEYFEKIKLKAKIERLLD